MEELQICTFVFQTKIKAKQFGLKEIFIDYFKADEISFKMMRNLLKNDNYFSCNSNLKFE